MSYEPLHPKVTATVTRLQAGSFEGKPTLTEVSVGTVEGGIEDISGKIRRSPGGVNIDLAYRFYTGDVATIFRRRDLFAFTYREEDFKLRVDDLVGPFGSGPEDHQEITLVSRFGEGVGFAAAGA